MCACFRASAARSARWPGRAASAAAGARLQRPACSRCLRLVPPGPQLCCRPRSPTPAAAAAPPHAAGSDKSAIVGSLRDMLYKKRMERQLLAAKGLIAAPERPPDEDGPSGGLPPAGSGKPGGWVPPSLRNRIGGEGGEMMQKRRDENSVRVSNLSEDVTEVRRGGLAVWWHVLGWRCWAGRLSCWARWAGRGRCRLGGSVGCAAAAVARLLLRPITHLPITSPTHHCPHPPPQDDLAELFGPFGPIQRIFVAKDRETGGWAAGAAARVAEGLCRALGCALGSTPACCWHSAAAAVCRTAATQLQPLRRCPAPNPSPLLPQPSSPHTGESRGFAFINFIHREDALRAIAKLDGFGCATPAAACSAALLRCCGFPCGCPVVEPRQHPSDSALLTWLPTARPPPTPPLQLRQPHPVGLHGGAAPRAAVSARRPPARVACWRRCCAAGAPVRMNARGSRRAHVHRGCCQRCRRCSRHGHRSSAYRQLGCACCGKLSRLAGRDVVALGQRSG